MNEKQKLQSTLPYVTLEPVTPVKKGFFANNERLAVYETIIRLNKKIIGALSVGTLVTIVIGTVVYLHLPAQVRLSSTEVPVQNPITISFSRPVSSSLKYRFASDVQGEWKTSGSLFGGITKITFTPSVALAPAEKYQVILDNIQPLLGNKAAHSSSLTILTEKEPSITQLAPKVDGPSPITTGVVFKLASKNNDIRRLRLKSPDADLNSIIPTSKDDQTFTWSFKDKLKQGTTYRLELLDMKQPLDQRVLRTLTFSTVSEPKIVTATNTDHFYPNQTVTISFDQNMHQSANKFDFSCKGSGSWRDAKTYVFTPQKLEPTTSCSYTVKKGTISSDGGIVEADHSYSIKAPGEVYLASTSPSGDEVAISSGLSFIFDQPVDHASAESLFKITPNVSGSFSWNDTTLTFKPSSLAYQTSYAVSFGAGIKSVYGLSNKQALTSSFTTASQIKKLNVPSYRQQYSLSCEAASLRMALAYRGINLNDMQILNSIGYSPTPYNSATNTWDNPYKMFVGDVNGVIGITGWGVYSPPVASASTKLGRSASAVSGITAAQIAQAIYSDNPVVLWGISAGQTPRIMSWNTSDGPVRVAANAHVRIVYGVKGSVNNPVGFYIHDPLHPDIYWTKAQMEYNMTAGGNLTAQGVIVY